MHEGGGLTEEARIAALNRYDLWGTPSDPALDRLAEHARLLFAAPAAGISLVGLGAATWKTLLGAPRIDVERRASFCSRAIRSARAFAVEDAAEEPAFAANPHVIGEPRARSYLGAAVALPDGSRIGAFCVMDPVRRRFTALERELIESLADAAGEVVAQRFADQKDKLTGALHEDAFRAALRTAAAGRLRYGQVATLMVLEPDGLRALREADGGLRADDLLRRVAKRLILRHRETDVLGRVGRDRLALLMTETDLEGGMLAGERLRAALERTPLPDGPSDPEGGGEAPETGPTISIGVATVAPMADRTLDRDAMDAPVRLADDAMERAMQALRAVQTAGGAGVASTDGPHAPGAVAPPPERRRQA